MLTLGLRPERPETIARAARGASKHRPFLITRRLRVWRADTMLYVTSSARSHSGYFPVSVSAHCFLLPFILVMSSLSVRLRARDGWRRARRRRPTGSRLVGRCIFFRPPLVYHLGRDAVDSHGRFVTSPPRPLPNYDRDRGPRTRTAPRNYDRDADLMHHAPARLLRGIFGRAFFALKAVGASGDLGGLADLILTHCTCDSS
ncbi:hypothetical protein EVAR_8333_1 [Eumeta japonica]|uniref:Uncharacterized protein n=1 Tax=Eumeta variegata TaxID=151549 RepID=A0A4C1VD88_EUMVA|nr:hypothetical protein EVAR_8333_1 [Eumeta japonica]